MEELVLDDCGIVAGEFGAEQSLFTLSNLPNLRLLNTYNTGLAHDKHTMLGVVGPLCRVEEYPRTLEFFRAVIENDIKACRRHVDCGIDIDARMGPWGVQLMHESWSAQCEKSGPFFDCCHPDEHLRPSAIHLAVFFASVECLACIVFSGAITNSKAWFAEMSEKLDENGVVACLEMDVDKTKEYLIVRNMKLGLDPNASVESLDGLNYTPLEILEGCMERNLHRVTCGFLRNKIYNWKDICNYNSRHMDECLRGTIDANMKRVGIKPLPARSREEEETNKVEAAMLLAGNKNKGKAAATANITTDSTADATVDADAAEKKEDSKDLSADRPKSAKIEETEKEKEKESPKSAKKEAKEGDEDAQAQEKKERKEGDEEEEEEEEEEDWAALQNAQMEKDKETAEEAAREAAALLPPPEPEPEPEPEPAVPVVRGSYREWPPYVGSADPWHSFGLVQKLTGDHILVKSLAGEHVELLGKRSYYLESIAQTLHIRHRTEDEAKARRMFRDTLGRTSKMNPMYFTDLNARKEEIYKLVDKEYNKRSVIRDDKEEDD